MKPAILISGATGYLGAELTRKLVARGHRVIALARHLERARESLDPNVEWLEGDLVDDESIRRAFARLGEIPGERWSVHAGALISYRSADRDLARAVNVEGTRRWLAGCRAVGVSRLLHVSSVVAIGPAPRDEEFDEDSPFLGAPLRCDYMDTKRAAEDLVLEAKDLDVRVVNPGAIFGASPRASNTQRALAMIATGKTGAFPRLFAPPGCQSVVGLDDCAEGCALALDRGRRGRRYALVESVWSHADWIALVARRLDQRPPWRVPNAVWSGAELALRALDACADLDFFTPQTMRMARARFAIRGDRARRELGWTPRPFAEVIDLAIRDLGLRGPSPTSTG